MRAVSSPLPETASISFAVGVVETTVVETRESRSAFQIPEMGIEEKVEKAMELVTAHLLATVREEIIQHEQEVT